MTYFELEIWEIAKSLTFLQKEMLRKRRSENLGEPQKYLIEFEEMFEFERSRSTVMFSSFDATIASVKSLSIVSWRIEAQISNLGFRNGDFKKLRSPFLM